MQIKNERIEVRRISKTPGLYTGEWDWRPNGQGVCVFEDGTKYEGEWSRGMPDGQGRLTRADGTWEEGSFCAGHFMHGRVRKMLYTGCIYEGAYEYPDDLLGGTLYYPDGRFFTGGFDDVDPHGPGTMTYPGGAYFDGNFVYGEPTGEGVFVFPDGTREPAEFCNGRLIDGEERTLKLLGIKREDLLSGPLPCLTVKREYSTFGGGHKGTYRFPVRVGRIPFSNMVMIDGNEGAAGTFEVVALTPDCVTFVVPGEYFADGIPQTHTLSLEGEERVFEHIVKGHATIEDSEYDYETVHRMTVSTKRD